MGDTLSSLFAVTIYCSQAVNTVASPEAGLCCAVRQPWGGPGVAHNSVGRCCAA